MEFAPKAPNALVLLRAELPPPPKIPPLPPVAIATPLALAVPKVLTALALAVAELREPKMLPRNPPLLPVAIATALASAGPKKVTALELERALLPPKPVKKGAQKGLNDPP